MKMTTFFKIFLIFYIIDSFSYSANSILEIMDVNDQIEIYKGLRAIKLRNDPELIKEELKNNLQDIIYLSNGYTFIPSGYEFQFLFAISIFFSLLCLNNVIALIYVFKDNYSAIPCMIFTYFTHYYSILLFLNFLYELFVLIDDSKGNGLPLTTKLFSLVVILLMMNIYWSRETLDFYKYKKKQKSKKSVEDKDINEETINKELNA